ncbi:MAG: hypothetical protein GXN92_02885 [Candidatus Micrarchaeota archaeon]|nr:hypothetical protein [Candidatus Micrarchaeota archaeon]
MKAYYWGILALLVLLAGCVDVCQTSECFLDAVLDCRPITYKHPFHYVDETLEATGFIVFSLDKTPEGCRMEVSYENLQIRYRWELRQQLLQNYTLEEIKQKEEELLRKVARPFICEFKNYSALYGLLVTSVFKEEPDLSIYLHAERLFMEEDLGHCYKFKNLTSE